MDNHFPPNDSQPRTRFILNDPVTQSKAIISFYVTLTVLTIVAFVFVG